MGTSRGVTIRRKSAWLGQFTCRYLTLRNHKDKETICQQNNLHSKNCVEAVLESSESHTVNT